MLAFLVVCARLLVGLPLAALFTTMTLWRFGFHVVAARVFPIRPTAVRAPTKLEDRLDGLRKKRKHNEVALLEDHKAKVLAALDWAGKNVSELAMARLSESFDVLDRAGFVVPLQQRLACTLRAATDFLEARAWSKWAKVATPFASDPNPEAEVDMHWAPGNASFSTLEVPEADAAEAHTLFFQTWSRATINDALVNMVVDCCPIAGSDMTAEPIVALRACLAAFLAPLADAGEPPEEWATQPVFQETVKCMRGLLALVDPTPAPCGATMDDVLYVLPTRKAKSAENGSTLESSKHIVLNRGLWRWLQKTNEDGKNEWRQRQELYLASMAAETSVGEQLADLTLAFEELRSEMEEASAFCHRLIVHAVAAFSIVLFVCRAIRLHNFP